MCLSKFLYWSYKQLFCCQRRVIRALFQEELPRKTLWIEIPPPEHPWIYICALTSTGEEIDVTHIVNHNVKEGDILTPQSLSEMTNIRDAAGWEYMDVFTYEEHEITSDGLVNVVRPKTD